MEALRVKSDEEAIRNALTSLKTATGIPVTMYAECLGEDRLQIGAWVGLRTPALQNLTIASGCGVGGRVMATRRPVGVSDYTRANVISHEYDKAIQDEGLYSIVAVPVIVNRRVRGVLYVGVHSPVRLGDKVIEEVTMTARKLEQDFAVADALEQQDPEHPVAQRSGRVMNSAEWEQIRAAHCVALGHTNVEAAEEMGIGAETVKSYLRSVMRKLGAHTRYEAVNAARRMGAIP